MMNEPEIRSFELMELRVDAGQNGAPTIYGYASVYDTLSEDLGYFREKVAKGAFARAIREDDVRGLFNHNPLYVLGRNKAGTLKLWEDIHGLRFEVQPPDAQWARDLAESIKRGDINQMSFGFQTIKAEWEYIDDAARAAELKTDVIRTLLEVRLLDISVVTYPAYPHTSADVREQAKALVEERNLAKAAAAGAQADEIGVQAHTEILRMRLDLAEIE
jgi:uncharacterized protein